MNHIAPIPARITGWDRAAIVALGGAGCALSYDALQQMAIAIHIRGFLTYVFPLVIDGFIAYGVRALLVLRTAPLAARCYVWLLFGTATAASIWANALHAVRLNQQRPDGTGLRLGDVTVGILSTLAPLALAGAVHLYILIARGVTEPAVPGHPDTTSVRADRVTADRQDTPVSQDEPRPAPVTSGHQVELPAQETNRPAVTVGQDTQEAGASQDPSGQQDGLAEPEPEHNGRTTDLGGHPASRPSPLTRLHPATQPETDPVTTAQNEDNHTPDTDPVTEELLPIARQAVTEAGKATRQVVADAIRGQNLPLSNDRLTVLMRRLRTETHTKPVTKTG
ncbi:DUF2637 domain-containing protein [Streptomyces sp. Je 1-4]|uniref:DUF2637 domain-containing protein n=1 Tax=Streptomyces TaxID=1883 RepID=UPI0021D88C9D|nr:MULTISPECIES: DUF2637 domain-containing protein [unclassified Streptomyces]UYB40919.1 DUF2637 domain-containing protein [Streptomyces sp. Je 1-4]UZQ37079.1 DUF2637 domain-containing protein [Streptomyces sp. Je 1-4] [Streptomyces sp. Je 1-4 4N24]UZQ44496.1 DUF2637 domain-containing protein [Streptomyces sp. Je 1-4] [Streptomyces sp. Je 1-4 4N24_ara]